MPGEAEQTERMARGGGVEDDVVDIWRIPGQKPDEFVEGRDLDRAGARELFAHRGLLAFGGVGAELVDHAGAVILGRLVGVDIHRRQVRRAGDGGRMVGEACAQHLVKVRRGVGADQQHPSALIGQRQRDGATERCFSDAALAREEQESAWGLAEIGRQACGASGWVWRDPAAIRGTLR